MRAGRPRHQIGPSYGRAQRQSAGNAFRHRQNVRRRLKMLRRPHLPGPADTRLHFVENEQHTKPLGDTRQFVEEFLRRDDVAALALHRLDDDGRHFVGRQDRFHELVFDYLGALDGTSVRRFAISTAITIRIRNVMYARHERAEATALRGFARRERERAEGSAVEGAKERDEFFAARGVTSELERRFDRFRARIAERYTPFAAAGSDFGELLGQSDHVFVVKVGARHVHQVGSLALNGIDHSGVTMTRGNHGDAGIEIEKTVAVHIFHDGALAALGDQRVGACVRRRNDLAVALDNPPRTRPRQSARNDRQVRTDRIQRALHKSSNFFVSLPGKDRPVRRVTNQNRRGWDARWRAGTPCLYCSPGGQATEGETGRNSGYKVANRRISGPCPYLVPSVARPARWGPH